MKTAELFLWQMQHSDKYCVLQP